MKETVVRPYLIGICGGSASGKTSIAEAISSGVGGKVPIVSLDWYYRPVDKSEGPNHNWDHPDSFDWALLEDHIDAWKRGETRWAPRHDYANYAQIYDATEIVPAPVMIFEGILAFSNEKIRGKLDLLIYVKCDLDTALKRRLLRDVDQRGYDLDSVLDRYVRHVKPAFEEFIAPCERIAHFIIFNNGDDGIVSGKKITHGGVHMVAEYIRLKLIHH